jgi:hypothetical protein
MFDEYRECELRKRDVIRETAGLMVLCAGLFAVVIFLFCQTP